MGHLLRPHECGLCTHDIAKLSALWLLLDDGWRSTFLPNEPPSEISGYGPAILFIQYLYSNYTNLMIFSLDMFFSS